MTKDQFLAVTKWQEETFGKQNPLPKLSHLNEEIKELINDIKTGSKNKRLEWADCFILLFGGAHSDGMTFEDISNAVSEKMEINRKRKWGKPDINGVQSHIK